MRQHTYWFEAIEDRPKQQGVHMYPFIPHEIYSPYAREIGESEKPSTDNETAGTPAPRMISHPGSGQKGISGRLPGDPDSGEQSALPMRYTELPNDIKRTLLTLQLAGKTPEEGLAALRNYALVSKDACEEVRNFLAEPTLLLLALQHTRHAVPELNILPYRTGKRQDEVAARMHKLASDYPQLYADFSQHAKVPRRMLNRASSWLPNFVRYQKPFFNVALDERAHAVKALLASNNLTFLQLRLDEDEHTSDARPRDNAVTQVCNFLRTTALGEPTNLQLHLECRFMNPDHTMGLLSALARYAGLTVVRGLNLQGSLTRHNSVQRAQAMRHIVDFIKQNESLLQLNLSDNRITGDEATLLANALKSHSSITELHLTNNQLYDTGSMALAELLSNGSPIRILALENNHIYEVGTGALDTALKVNTALEQLYLGDNPARYPAIWLDHGSRLQTASSKLVQSMPPMKNTP